jgi:hypothetical protein
MPRVETGRIGWLVRVVALAGAGAMVAAVFVPIDRGGAKLLDVTHGSDAVRQTGSAAVPATGAAIAILVLALVPRAGRRAAAAIAGIGGVVALYFLFVVLSIEVPVHHIPFRDLRAGAFIGLVGGLAALAAGMIGALGPEPTAAQPVAGAAAVLEPTRQATAHEATALAPAGWYPDPSGQARERYWDGHSWTESAR